MDMNASSLTGGTHADVIDDGSMSCEAGMPSAANQVFWQTTVPIPEMSIGHISARVAAVMERKISSEFPQSADGSVRFTLFERCMPHEWLWHNDRMLPVLLAVGASRLRLIVPLEPAQRDSLTGYRIRERAFFCDDLVHAAFADAVWDEHEIFNKRKPTGKVGKHLELGRWSQDGLFHRVATQNGFQPKRFVTHAQKLLPDRFYQNPNIATGFKF